MSHAQRAWNVQRDARTSSYNGGLPHRFDWFTQRHLAVSRVRLFALQPLLRWAYESLLLEELDLDHIPEHELTGSDQYGGKAEPTGIWKVLFHLESYLTHCKEGKNRTGLMLAAFLVAFYHETKLSVEDAMIYCRQVRPIIDFASEHDHYDCPMVSRGGTVQRSLWSRRRVVNS